MPVNKNIEKHETNATDKREKSVVPSGKSGRKAPGTRLGMLDDWREGSAKSGKLSGRHGHTIRDGR